MPQIRYWKSLAKRTAYIAKANRNFSSNKLSSSKNPNQEYDSSFLDIEEQDLIEKPQLRLVYFKDVGIDQVFYFGNPPRKFWKFNASEGFYFMRSGKVSYIKFLASKQVVIEVKEDSFIDKKDLIKDSHLIFIPFKDVKFDQVFYSDYPPHKFRKFNASEGFYFTSSGKISYIDFPTSQKVVIRQNKDLSNEINEPDEIELALCLIEKMRDSQPRNYVVDPELERLRAELDDI